MEISIGKCYDIDGGCYSKVIERGRDFTTLLVIGINANDVQMRISTTPNCFLRKPESEITQSEFNMKYAEFLKQSEKLFKTKVKRK